MPVVGICRHGRDNNYLFAAEDEPAPGHFTNLAFYHDAASTYGYAFRTQFPRASLTREDRVLVTFDRTVFSGADLIRTYRITMEAYADIFDHSHDSERLLANARKRLESDANSITGEEIEGELRTIEERLGKYPLRQEDVEYGRALDAACEAGFFDDMVVNGHPRAVGSIISIS